MSWVKLDDGFADHPKIVGLDDRAFRWFVWSLCYSGRQLTDGFVPFGVLRGGPLVTRKYTFERALRVLSGAGLWREVEGGIEIHDFLDYNPDRASMLEKRANDAARQRRSRANRSQARHGVTDPVTEKRVTGSPARPQVHKPKAVEKGQRRGLGENSSKEPERLGDEVCAQLEKARPAKEPPF